MVPVSEIQSYPLCLSVPPYKKIHPFLQMTDSEKTIADKKKEVEKLVMEMKDANLESLSITPSEEVRTLLEGKTGRVPHTTTTTTTLL